MVKCTRSPTRPLAPVAFSYKKALEAPEQTQPPTREHDKGKRAAIDGEHHVVHPPRRRR